MLTPFAWRTWASTSVAAVYHYAFGWTAPYTLGSLPVLLGTAGGIGLLIGPAGLWWLDAQRHPAHGDPRARPMDRAFIALLFLTSLTGMLLLGLWLLVGFAWDWRRAVTTRAGALTREPLQLAVHDRAHVARGLAGP